MFASPPLPYALNALAPAISPSSVRRHYEDNQAGYFRNTNQLLRGEPAYRGQSLLDVALTAPLDSPLANNAAQAWAHVFWWASMSPKPQPTPAWVSPRFAEAWVEQGAALFGSGWLWLSVLPEGCIGVEALPNAVLPQRHGHVPILVMDLWEHAYYCQYGTKRRDYLRKTLPLLNWAEAERRLRALAF